MHNLVDGIEFKVGMTIFSIDTCMPIITSEDTHEICINNENVSCLRTKSDRKDSFGPPLHSFASRWSLAKLAMTISDKNSENHKLMSQISENQIFIKQVVKELFPNYIKKYYNIEFPPDFQYHSYTHKPLDNKYA